MKDKRRPEFRDWLDSIESPPWGPMPLTHVCKALIANDVVRNGQIEPSHCPVFDRALAYFFYGRPAYRTTGDGPIRNMAACPMCFVFNPDTPLSDFEIHPFDTGAYANRLYTHALMDEMTIGDFSLEDDTRRINKLITRVYGSRRAYYDFDRSQTNNLGSTIPPSEFLANSYIDLMLSRGRNEPDDRVGTIEIMTSNPVSVEGNLIAIVVPDVIWSDDDRSKWISTLSRSGVDILPFRYVQARSPDYYHAMIEATLRDYMERRGYL